MNLLGLQNAQEVACQETKKYAVARKSIGLTIWWYGYPESLLNGEPRSYQQFPKQTIHCCLSFAHQVGALTLLALRCVGLMNVSYTYGQAELRKQEAIIAPHIDQRREKQTLTRNTGCPLIPTSKLSNFRPRIQ